MQLSSKNLNISNKPLLRKHNGNKDLQEILELTPKKDVLFITGDWNEKVGGQEIPGVTGKFGLGVQNEAGQRLIGFCQEIWSQQTHSSNNTREYSTHGHH